MGVDTGKSAKKSKYPENSFVPKINHTSRLLAQDRNSKYELMKPSQKKELKKTQVEYLEGKLNEFTFQPEVNQNYRHIQGPPPTNKERIALEYKCQKVEKEMKECNFKPTLISKQNRRRTETQPVENKVNGMQRFYELQDLKRRKEAEKRAREEQVFGKQAVKPVSVTCKHTY